MLRRVTHGTSRDSMILVATVVFPEALPPQIPIANIFISNKILYLEIYIYIYINFYILYFYIHIKNLNQLSS